MEQTRIIPPDGSDSNRTQAMEDLEKTCIAGQKTLEVECLPGNRYALSNRPSREHFLVRVKSLAGAIGRRLPLNLALVIDRSGSMEGEPLDYVKRACAHVIDLLEPTDILSVVTFEEQVDVVVPARRVVNKTLLKEHLNRIQAGRTTNIYDGIVAGCQQIASVMSQGYVNRVLLLTDGEPTAGIKDFASIVRQVADQKNKGITITALGFGPEYNEELLAGIARRSGGNYYYISRPDLIPEVFRRELQSLLTITARNLRMKITLSRWVQVRQAYGRQFATVDPKHVELSLVDLERGSALAVLWEIEFAPRPAGVYRVAKVELTYDDTLTGTTERVEQNIVFEFTTDEKLVAENTDPIVKQELEIAQASRNLEKTVMGMKTQQISTASATIELERTMSLLAAQGRSEEAAEVGRAIEAIKQGGADAEKTLSEAIYSLDQGKRK